MWHFNYKYRVFEKHGKTVKYQKYPYSVEELLFRIHTTQQYKQIGFILVD